MNSQKGMTLIEILAVLVIMSIAGFFAFQYSNSEIQKTRLSNVETDFRMIKKSLDQYVIEYRELPSAAYVLSKPDEQEEWMKKINFFSDFTWEWDRTEGNYVVLKTAEQRDPWDNPYYMYLSKNTKESLIVLSSGPNAQLADFSNGIFDDDLAFIFEKK